MSPTLHALANLIAEDDPRMGVRSVPPAAPADVQSVAARSMQVLGCQMPDQYLSFLTRMDGFYVSSMQLFGSRRRQLEYAGGRGRAAVWVDGVIEMTQELRIDRSDSEHVVFLVYDASVRGWDPVRAEWFRDHHDGGRARTYRNFEELLADGLWDVGLDVRHLMPSDFVFHSYDEHGKPVYGTRLP